MKHRTSASRLLPTALLVLVAAILGACGDGTSPDTDGDVTISFAPAAQGQAMAIGDSLLFIASAEPAGTLAVSWRRGGQVVGNAPSYRYRALNVGRDTLRVTAESGSTSRSYYWVIDVASTPETVPPLVPNFQVAPGPDPVQVVVTWSRVAGSTFPIVGYDVVLSYTGPLTAANWEAAIPLGTVAHVAGQVGYSTTYDAAGGELIAGAEAWFGVRARDDHGQLSGTAASRYTRITTEWWIDGRIIDDAGEPLLGVIASSLAPVRNANTDGEGRFRLGPFRSVDSVRVHTTSIGYYDFTTGKLNAAADVPFEIVLPIRHQLAPECTAYGGDYLTWFRSLTRTTPSATDTTASRIWKWDHWPVTVFLPDSTTSGGRDMDAMGREMLALWNQELGAEYLREVASRAEADIYFAWVTDSSGGYGQAGLDDPPGGVLGDVIPRRVRIEVETGILTDQFFREVCLHELGHGLGLTSHSLECDGAGHLMVLGASGNLLLPSPIHPDELNAVRIVRRLPQGADLRWYGP